MARTYLPPTCIFPLCATRAQRRIRCTAPPSLNLGTRWRWVVNFPLHSRARIPVPNKQEAGLVPEPVSTFSKTEKSFNRVGNRTLDRPAYSLFTTMSYQWIDSVSKSAVTLKKGTSVIRQEWRYCAVPRRKNAGKISDFGRDRFLPYLFKFIIHQLHYIQGYKKYVFTTDIGRWIWKQCSNEMSRDLNQRINSVSVVAE